MFMGHTATAIAAALDAMTLPDLLEASEASTLDGFGALVTYSRKVFIPLTRLCRDVCHYCTFATTPRALATAYLSRAQVLAIAQAGAAAGCREALFTLGDQPETRFAEARAALDLLGHDSTLSYLREMAEMVLTETGLLPHLNPGLMTEADLVALRPVCASMGIMLETSSARLSRRGGPHYGSPDKDPALRLATIEAAGRARVPFTTGLLIGIGETRDERVEALVALRDCQARHGHIQEVIIQNFRAKPGTRMAGHAEPALEEHLWTVAAARLILGPAMSIQAPPNLQPHALGALLRAGVNDWGGVSPVTQDHVNPEAPWPQLQALDEATSQAGRVLRQRLAIGPAHARAPERWLDAKLATRVRRQVDARGLPLTEDWRAGGGRPVPPLPRAGVTAVTARLEQLIDQARAGVRLELDQTKAPPTIHKLPDPDGDDDDDIAADDPKNQERFNRELWESIKHTPYKDALAYVARAQRAEATRQLARPDANTVTLPTGWKITPAGASVAVGRLPYMAVPFSGRIVVLNNGYYTGRAPEDQPEVSVVDPATHQVERTLHFGALFPSAIVGGEKEGGDLFVSGGFSRQIFRIDRAWKTVRTYTLDSGYAGPLAPIDATHIAVASLVASATTETYDKGQYGEGRIAILNTETGAIERETTVGYFPFALRAAHGKLYAAVLGEDKVTVFDQELKPVKTIRVGRSPEDIAVDGDQLYVVNANSDSVSVVDTRRDEVTATISLADKGTRYGGAPTSCVVAGDRLYVTLANVNAVAVLDKRTNHLLGYVPTGWYPTRALVDHDHLFIVSAKGIRPRRPNPPNPPAQNGVPAGPYAYVLTLLQGALADIPLADVPAHLAAWTRQVADGSPLFSPTSHLAPPIHHVFYVVRENRTYDQVFGDLPKANGDPTLTLFGRDITPNAHRLAEQFVTLDNYFTDAEISVLGHSITTSGYASPFLEWIGNTSYAGRYKSYPYGSVPAVTSPEYLWDALDARHIDYRIYGENYFLHTRGFALVNAEFGADSPIAKKFYAQMMALATKTDRGRQFYDFASRYYPRTTTSEAAEALLSDAAFVAQLSQFLTGDDSLVAPLAARPALRRQFAEYLHRYPANYRSWDLGTSDLARFDAWKADFDEQVRQGRVAPLQYLWLPNDHTGGAGKNPLYPDQLVAQNDAALARIVQTIADSPVWKDSLILVTEDDAQDGPDHVDATRTVGLAIGPSVRRGAVVHERYDQLSLLRTIELILGLDPLNRTDALAVPMFGIFADKADDAKPDAPVVSSHLAEGDKVKFSDP